jgi:hypothetical protein
MYLNFNAFQVVLLIILISDEMLRDILEEVRKLRRKRKRLLLLPTADNRTGSDIENEELGHKDEEVIPYIQ